MQDNSVIAVFDRTGDRVLLCERTRDPYKGMLDFVGGKQAPEETPLACAYRELREETGIPKDAIALYPIVDILYHTSQWCIHVFAGQLKLEVHLVEEINPLRWSSLHENFYDEKRYAGEGYIGLVLSQVRMQLFAPGV